MAFVKNAPWWMFSVGIHTVVLLGTCFACLEWIRTPDKDARLMICDLSRYFARFDGVGPPDEGHYFNHRALIDDFSPFSANSDLLMGAGGDGWGRGRDHHCCCYGCCCSGVPSPLPIPRRPPDPMPRAREARV